MGLDGGASGSHIPDGSGVDDRSAGICCAAGGKDRYQHRGGSLCDPVTKASGGCAHLRTTASSADRPCPTARASTPAAAAASAAPPGTTLINTASCCSDADSGGGDPANG